MLTIFTGNDGFYDDSGTKGLEAGRVCIGNIL